jgi:ElaB/YqjD/DUF883 family membrane-anchored ribosome-binding protein
MKLLLFACLLGFAAADILQRAAPAIDQSVLAFMEGAFEAGSVSELGIDDPEVEQLAQFVESEVARKVKEALRELVERIKESIDQGKSVGQGLLEKVKELRDKLKEYGGEEGEKAKEMLKKIREKAKEALKEILEKLGVGTMNLDDSMDKVARMKFRELVERIKEKLSSNETIQKIREYLKNHVGNSELLQKLKEFVARLKDSDLRQLIHDFFDYHHQQKSVTFRGDTWNKVKEFFKDLNVKIKDHSKKFGQWVKDMWGKGLDKLKEKYGTIKAIAMEFIANSKDMSSEMAREALEFFRPYKDDLGVLWKQIVDASKEAIGKF